MPHSFGTCLNSATLDPVDAFLIVTSLDPVDALNIILSTYSDLLARLANLIWVFGVDT